MSTDAPGRAHLAVLDGLLGLAIVLVVATHSLLTDGFERPLLRLGTRGAFEVYVLRPLASSTVGRARKWKGKILGLPLEP